MPRTVSSNFLAEILKQSSGLGVAVLFTITHPSYAGTLRVTNNYILPRISDTPLLYGVVSGGNTFYFHPMTAQLPSDVSKRAPSARLVMDNVGRDLIDFAMAVTSPGLCTIQVVLTSTPNVIEMTFANLNIRNIQGNDATISFDFGEDALEREQFPKGKVVPSQFPGSFP